MATYFFDPGYQFNWQARTSGNIMTGGWSLPMRWYAADTNEFSLIVDGVEQFYRIDQSPIGTWWSVLYDTDGRTRGRFIMATPGHWYSIDYRYSGTQFTSGLTYTMFLEGDEPITYVICDIDNVHTRETLYSPDGIEINLTGQSVSNYGGINAHGAPWLSAFMYHLTDAHRVGGGSDTPSIPHVDPYGTIGTGNIGPGQGYLGGDQITLPIRPAIDGVSTGLFSLFAPTVLEMQSLASYLWTESFSVGEVAESINRLVADPTKLMLGLYILPSQGLQTGVPKRIKVGPWSTTVDMTPLEKQFFDVDCGSLQFDTVCGDTFLDYAPYSKFSIYLPYCGIKQVDANDFVGHTISVRYRCDAASGACVAFILKDGSVMYQYSGNLATNLPLTSESWAQTWSAMVNLGTSIGGAIVGSATGAATAGLGLLSSVANVAQNPSVLSPDVQHSGSIGGSAGLLGVQKPYVIREAQTFQKMDNFNSLTGYPLNIYKRLSELTGFTVVQQIHVEAINATQTELNRIEQLLKEGVIL